MTNKLTSFGRFFLVILSLSVSIALWVCFVYFVALDNSSFNGEQITRFGLKVEILLLLNITFLILLFSKRVILTILLSIIIYSLFIFATLEKIKFFNNPLLPLDFKYINQLFLILPAFKIYFYIFLGVIISILAIIIIFRRLEPKIHFLSGLNKFKQLIVFSIIFVVGIKISGLYQDLVITLAKNERGRAHLVYTSERDGLFTTFARNILHVSANKSPPGYSLNKINNIYNNKIKNQLDVSTKHDEKINLVIYLIESFIDPQDFGINSTQDPIPFFHHLQKHHESGYAYSPVIGGRSANAEFEILTGFSKHFFDPASIPFIDLPIRKIPSIANELKSVGYFTKVIQASSLDFFNYKSMYNMLGFSEIISLYNKKDVPLDIAGRNPSDLAIVDELIETAEKHQRFFLYAFPNSTHGLWNYDAYDNSELDIILTEPLSNTDGEKDLKTYLNSLRTADLAIKKLITYFEKQNRKTVVLIIGDHQPGMPEIIEQYMFNQFPNRFKQGGRRQLKKQFNKFHKENLLESYEIMHRVPYVIWTNFETDIIDNKNRGMNEIASRTFQIINHPYQSTFYTFLEKFIQKTRYTDILKYVFLDEENLSPEKIDWLQSYEQLQYDILLGQNHLKELSQ